MPETVVRVLTARTLAEGYVLEKERKLSREVTIPINAETFPVPDCDGLQGSYANFHSMCVKENSSQREWEKSGL